MENNNSAITKISHYSIYQSVILVGGKTRFGRNGAISLIAVRSHHHETIVVSLISTISATLCVFRLLVQTQL